MRTNRKTMLSLALAALFLSTAWSGRAVLLLPDIGVDYAALTVSEPDKLKQIGMRDVRAGDPVTVQHEQDGRTTVRNLRTGQAVTFGPADTRRPPKR